MRENECCVEKVKKMQTRVEVIGENVVDDGMKREREEEKTEGKKKNRLALDCLSRQKGRQVTWRTSVKYGGKSERVASYGDGDSHAGERCTMLDLVRSALCTFLPPH